MRAPVQGSVCMKVFELRRILHDVPGHFDVYLGQVDTDGETSEVVESLPAKDPESFAVDNVAQEIHLL